MMMPPKPVWDQMVLTNSLLKEVKSLKEQYQKIMKEINDKEREFALQEQILIRVLGEWDGNFIEEKSPVDEKSE